MRIQCIRSRRVSSDCNLRACPNPAGCFHRLEHTRPPPYVHSGIDAQSRRREARGSPARGIDLPAMDVRAGCGSWEQSTACLCGNKRSRYSEVFPPEPGAGRQAQSGLPLNRSRASATPPEWNSTYRHGRKQGYKPPGPDMLLPTLKPTPRSAAWLHPSQPRYR